MFMCIHWLVSFVILLFFYITHHFKIFSLIDTKTFHPIFIQRDKDRKLSSVDRTHVNVLINHPAHMFWGKNIKKDGGAFPESRLWGSAHSRWGGFVYTVTSQLLLHQQASVAWVANGNAAAAAAREAAGVLGWCEWGRFGWRVTLVCVVVVLRVIKMLKPQKSLICESFSATFVKRILSDVNYSDPKPPWPHWHESWLSTFWIRLNNQRTFYSRVLFCCFFKSACFSLLSAKLSSTSVLVTG